MEVVIIIKTRVEKSSEKLGGIAHCMIGDVQSSIFVIDCVSRAHMSFFFLVQFFILWISQSHLLLEVRYYIGCCLCSRSCFKRNKSTKNMSL